MVRSTTPDATSVVTLSNAERRVCLPERRVGARASALFISAALDCDLRAPFGVTSAVWLHSCESPLVRSFTGSGSYIDMTQHHAGPSLTGSYLCFDDPQITNCSSSAVTNYCTMVGIQFIGNNVTCHM